jgi:TRAP-type uncharacterized transport system substrate-binding protein
MLGYNRWQLFKGLGASLCIVGVVSLALMYFIPAPPSKVVMASSVRGTRGTTFEYFARQYQEIFARSNIELELRETGGAVDNVKLLLDPSSDVEIALVVGGCFGRETCTGIVIVRNGVQQPVLDFLFVE